MILQSDIKHREPQIKSVKLDSQWLAFIRRLRGLKAGKRYSITLDTTSVEITWEVGEFSGVEKFFRN